MTTVATTGRPSYPWRVTEITGALQPGQRDSLEAFADALEQHPRRAAADGRLVVAEPHPGGLQPTIQRVLRLYMKPDEYEAWWQQQAGRPVATAGKTFVAQDEVITACVIPHPEISILLGYASHELIEIAHLAAERQEGTRPLEDHEVNGTTIADEYVAERLRIEIATQLGWPRSPLDRDPGLVPQTDDIQGVLSRPPYDGPPTMEFWQHWANLARVWAMVAGRADAGAQEEEQELIRWLGHRLIADQGWQPVRHALQDLYGPPEPDREQFVAGAVRCVWDPVERYGRGAWAAS
jgi:hypothetical protein